MVIGAAANRGRIDVKRLIVLRPIKNQGNPSCRGFSIAKILKNRQLHPRQGCIRWMSEYDAQHYIAMRVRDRFKRKLDEN
jgi:hypothetical protein